MGDAHPTGLLNEITTKAQLSPSTPTCFLRIDDNHKKIFNSPRKLYAAGYQKQIISSIQELAPRRIPALVKKIILQLPSPNPSFLLTETDPTW